MSSIAFVSVSKQYGDVDAVTRSDATLRDRCARICEFQFYLLRASKGNATVLDQNSRERAIY